MIERYSHNTITWLDVVSPSADEIKQLVAECDLPRDFTHDLSTPTPRTEVFSKKGFLKITLDFPIVKRTDITHPHEVKFIVTKSHLITIRFEDIGAIHSFSKEFEMLSISKGKKRPDSEKLFISLLGRFYEAMYEKLDYIDSKLRDIEEEIFNEHEEEMVFELSNISRRLISFKQTIDAHNDALEKLSDAAKESFKKDYSTSIGAIIHQYSIVRRRLRALTSTFNDLRQTNDTLLATKQNGFMRVFTIIAFLTFPLTLFTSMFGMNAAHTPIIGHPYDFWIILSVMACVTISFFAYFKYRNWL